MLFYLRAFFQGARIQTLSAIIVPIVMTTAFAFYRENIFDRSIFIFTLLSGCFLQMSLNFANDALDFQAGTDTSDRLGPARLSAQGQLPPSMVWFFAGFCSVMSLLFGIPLVIQGGWLLACTGLIFLGLCYTYTGFRYSFVRIGLAELMCVLFFGLAAVIGTYYLQTLNFDYQSLYLGIQCGLWALSILLVNYLRDEEEDKKSGRKTVVTVYGRIAGLFVLAVSQCFIYLFCFYWMGERNDGGAISFLVFVPFFILFYFICNTPPSKKYNQFLFWMSCLYMMFGLAWVVGL